MTIFYCLRSETPPTWRAVSPHLYPPWIGWPGCTPGIGFPFLASCDSQATVEVFDPASTGDWILEPLVQVFRLIAALTCPLKRNVTVEINNFPSFQRTRWSTYTNRRPVCLLYKKSVTKKMKLVPPADVTRNKREFLWEHSGLMSRVQDRRRKDLSMALQPLWTSALYGWWAYRKATTYTQNNINAE
jgi:hypothetical protein